MDALAPGDPERVGCYRLLYLLGTGGMGRVYLGESPDGAMVAVKLIRPDLAGHPDFRRRFAQEVAAARRVERPVHGPGRRRRSRRPAAVAGDHVRRRPVSGRRGGQPRAVQRHRGAHARRRAGGRARPPCTRPASCTAT